jgi:hypothetical protein
MFDENPKNFWLHVIPPKVALRDKPSDRSRWASGSKATRASRQRLIPNSPGLVTSYESDRTAFSPAKIPVTTA